MSLPRIVATPGGLIASALKLALVAAVIIAIVPPLRQRAVPYLGAAVNPIRRVSVQDRVNSVARHVEYETRITGEAPQDRDLPRVLKRMYPNRKDVMMDPWGRRYFLRRRRDGFQVGSAGPDQRRDTRDDVMSRMHPLPTARRADAEH